MKAVNERHAGSAELQAVLDHYPDARREHLIPILQAVQDRMGYLSREAVKQNLKIEPGQTTRDGVHSLEVVACIGACGLAPVVTVNGDFHAGVTPDSVRKILKQYSKGDANHGK